MNALITGGDSGIGLAFAEELAARGYRLWIVSNREESLAQVRENLGAQTLWADLAAHGAAEKVARWCPAPDVLICNAGMFFMQYLSPENLPKVQAMMALHMESVTELCILLGGKMKERGSGHILILSSMTARIPAPGIAIYSATKTYLKSFGKSFSYEMRPYGVKVCTLCPSAVDTGLYPLGPKLRKTLRSLGIIRSPRWMARRGLRALFGGRRSVSPGLMNFLLPPIIGLMPNRLIDYLGMKWINTPAPPSPDNGPTHTDGPDKAA